MFLAIILTFVITALTMTVLVLRSELVACKNDKKTLKKDNDSLRHQITDYCDRERNHREQRAYNMGLHDGRETDALYRSLLSKYKKGDRVTVMCNGKEVDEDYE